MSEPRVSYRVEQRRRVSPLPMVQDWSTYTECDTATAAAEAVVRLNEYDAFYSLTGWEYQVKEVKVKGRK
jgi:hypothetical protein